MCSSGTPNWSASICAKVVSFPCPCGDAPVVALIRPSRSIVTCECSHPPVGSDEDGPMPQTSTYIASPRPTSRPWARAASRSAFKRSHCAVFERHVERLLVVARVVDRAHLRRERKLIRLDEVLPAELRRIHLQLAREHVHRALDEVGRLGTAGAAIGIGRRLVREDFGQRRANGRNVVGRVRHHHRERRDGRRQQHVVGADIGDQAHLQAEHGAIALRREIHVAEDVAAVGRGHEGFRAVLRPTSPECRGAWRSRPPRTLRA